MKLLKCLIPFILLCLAIPAKAVLLMPWERLPLAIPLVVGQERVIFVDRNVRVGIPGSIANKLRVQTTNGTVYLLAREPIDPVRLQLQDAETGELILIDIAAVPAVEDDAPLESIRIIEGENPSRRYGTPAVTTQSQNPTTATNTPRRETPVPVILTRYAAQSLYAPLRTVEPVQGITRVNLRHNFDLSMLLPTLPVAATPMAAWRLEDFWVTAVKLQNTSNSVIELDPRLLQGDFIAATFQHHNLGPATHPADTTVVYLVTRKRGLAQSLLPALSQIDASINIHSRRHP
ncbi:hypothetical protein CUZ56_00223 [Saezia sanguinis]|uniref:Integrating conjugative element protein n=1 Tax=Saezia sanguinis TaxID=1965230 RepID=A0A433SGD6_9BURK|nr:TIGR03749 family integrating conjugative element protein [Saezia sanguinis]RUS67746.1 hypothetical protein CUZ56_00223 [Saezia sanguinis]